MAFRFGSKFFDEGSKQAFDFEFSTEPTETWVRNQYQTTYCNARGTQTMPFDADLFRTTLEKGRPSEIDKIAEAVKRWVHATPYGLRFKFHSHSK
jgi:hypothetical protein